MTTTEPHSSTTLNRSQSALLFIEWGALLAGLLICMPRKEYHPWLILVWILLAISWVARWARIRRPTRATPLDLPLLLFLLSLLVGFFVAPNFPTAFARLTLFIVAFSLFYALVNSTSLVIDRILTLILVMLAFFGPILISQYDWSLQTHRYIPLTVLGAVLNRLIPDLDLNLPAWDTLRNILASLLGLFLPILVLQVYRGLETVEISPKGSRGWYAGILKLVLLILTGFPILLTLVLTESRAPWLIYAVLLVIYLWWQLSRRIAEGIRVPHLPAFLGGVLLSIVLALIMMNNMYRDPRLISRLPGSDTFLSRLEIYSQSTYLTSDTPYTGGGLGAYPALYSFYIRGIPFDATFAEDTGNSLYLYILAEQGWLGLFSLILLLVIPLFIGLGNINRANAVNNSLLTVGMIGIGFIILHGFIHAILGASRAIPFLLLPAGLVFAGLGSIIQDAQQVDKQTHRFPSRLGMFVLLVLALALAAYLLIAPAPRAAWYANLGSVRMARVQLAGWPLEAWDDGSSLPALSPAQTLFHQALALNPQNRTANHRLGLIALLRQDFTAAVSYLEAAYNVNPDHRGVTKSLGYSLVWAGEIERGLELLQHIPEAPQELDAYVFFWLGLDRLDISDLADKARVRLQVPP